MEKDIVKQEGTYVLNNLDNLIRGNVLESMPSGLMVIGRQGQVLQVNSALCSILGYPGQYFKDKGCSGLFLDNPDNDDFVNVLLEVVQEEQVNHRRLVNYQRPDGKKLYLEIISSFLRASSQKWGLVVLIQDMTDFHLMHEREKYALQEKQINETLRAQSLNNLTLSIAHQIRNPVMAIGGFTSLAQRNLDKPDQVAIYLQSILDSARRLECMAGAVAKYASINRMPARKVRLLSSLNPALERIKKKADHMQMELEILKHETRQYEILFNPEQLDLAMDEILNNCLEAYDNYHKPKAVIEIRTTLIKDRVILEIQDHGRGIPEESMAYVCDPFFTTKAVGAGMGLATAERVLSENNSRLEIESHPGKGTIVTLYLPDWEHEKNSITASENSS